MLWQRVITALLLLPLVLVLVFFLPLELFAMAVACILVLGAREWGRFTSSERSAQLTAMLSYFGAAVLLWQLSPPFAFWPSLSWPEWLWSGDNLPLLVLALAVLFWLFSPVLLWFYPQRTGWWRTASGVRQGLGVLLLLATWVALVSLRKIGLMQGGGALFGLPKGALVIFYVLLLVWAADVGAYITGKMFGKHKLAPAVSPGKTWQGFWGGLVLALVIGHFAAQLFDLSSNSVWGFRALMLVTIIASVVGDLIESLCKREAGIKDSGTIFPGHGGMLDRIDSLMAAAPVFALGALLLELH
ncbi:phosphatidate cytidylyltransferase [Permianibacter sp. IMCC34836]|uniref:phosphatidate cytidylyltransferase n=1 Tax=Permianibacter fluminis TaxID=2738515 RepID=UPI0015559B50|nr:phosphatidate cytidylyltransferase [Permianibacter fluminis]NQD38682.1 phosphatidate cytidylyltransferase [Permianibacter fluminis]